MPVVKTFEIETSENQLITFRPCINGIFIDIDTIDSFTIIDVDECKDLIKYLSEIIKNHEL